MRASFVFRIIKASHVKRQNPDLTVGVVCVRSEISVYGGGTGQGKG